MVGLDACLWPAEQTEDAILALARASGLPTRRGTAPAGIRSGAGGDALSEPMLRWTGDRLGIEIESTETEVDGLEAALRSAAPALIEIHDAGGLRRLALLAGYRDGKVLLVDRDLRRHRVSAEALADALSAPLRRAAGTPVEPLLDAAGLSGRRRDMARDGLQRQRIGRLRIGGLHLLRTAAGAPVADGLAGFGPGRRLCGLLALLAAAYLLEGTGWWLIGAGTLDGRIDQGWLFGWSLLVASLIPVQWLGDRVGGRLAIDVTAWLKTRLLVGAMQLDPDVARRDGAGGLLGRVVEAQAFEAVALGGGVSAVTALFELALAVWILSLGAGGGLHAFALAGWVGFAAVAARWAFVSQARWTQERLDLTGDLVERMVGHRTLLAQERAGRRVAANDRALADYNEVSRLMDRDELRLAAFVPAAWLPIAIAGLVPAFVSGDATPAALSISLGGILVAQRAVGETTAGLGALSRAWIAWRAVAPILRAAAVEPSMTVGPRAKGHGKPGDLLVDLDGVTFRHPGRADPVLDGVSVTVARGDRVLLDGGSGSGKSTLAAILAGIRRPEAGLVLVDGLDRDSLGAEWHAAITEAPQFHDNHIFSGPLAFNLLMGRNWPPSRSDLDEAETLCRELGLGDLLDRMPGGLMQMVGETGWQLSQGERSRIGIARALLQDADLTILDESVAALDPENVERCMDVIRRRAGTFLLIAHP